LIVELLIAEGQQYALTAPVRAQLMLGVPAFTCLLSQKQGVYGTCQSYDTSGLGSTGGIGGMTVTFFTAVLTAAAAAAVVLACQNPAKYMIRPVVSVE
jgi:hypothetical protein